MERFIKRKEALRLGETMTTPTELVLRDIKRAPTTFINLALSSDGPVEILGPDALLPEKEGSPRYGITDEVLDKADSGTYFGEDRQNIDIVGSIFGPNPKRGDARNAVPLMLRLARAGVIVPTNYSESYDLNAWSATPEAGAEMKAIVKVTTPVPQFLAREIGKVLHPESTLDEGRSLHARIVEAYR